MILTHVKNLLFQHDCVIVPGLGAFLTKYRSADYNEKTHIYSPPGKSILFNENLKKDDGLLINEIVKQEKITKEAATKKVESFVKEFQQDLETKQMLSLDGIGTFTLNPKGEQSFSDAESDNYDPNNYGIQSFFIKPITQEARKAAIIKKVESAPAVSVVAQSEKTVEPTPVLVEEEEEETNKGLVWFLISFFILLLLLFFGWVGLNHYEGDSHFLQSLAFWKNQNNVEETSTNDEVVEAENGYENNDEYNQSNNDIDEYSDERDNKSDVDQEIVDGMAITELSERYHLISGAFNVESNAYKYKTQFARSHVLKWKSYYVVVLGNYHEESIAREKMAPLKQAFGDEQVWLLIR